MITGLHDFLAACTRVLGTNAPMKSRTSQTPLETPYGGIIGRCHQYTQARGNNVVMGTATALWNDPGSLFSSVATLFVLTHIAKRFSLDGAKNFGYDLTHKDIEEVVVERSTDFILNLGAKGLKGVVNAIAKFTQNLFIEFKETALLHAQEQANEFWRSAEDAHTLARLRHNEICMKNERCAALISEINNSPSAASYFIPVALTFSALSLATYLYSSYKSASLDEPSTDDSTKKT